MGKRPGLEAEDQVRVALDILTEDPDSLVAGYVWTSQGRSADKRMDSAGIDFLVKLTIADFVYFPLQVKRTSHARLNRMDSPSWRGKNQNLAKHYRTYPHFFALGVDERSPEKLASYLDEVITKLFTGEDIEIPGYPD